MKDMRPLIEDDAKRLTEAFLSGEIAPGTGVGRRSALAEFYSPQELQQFALAIIQRQLDNKSLSLVMPFLSSMKWLSLQEACIYARKSRNTLLKLIAENAIYGTKPEGSGDYIIDRESIDGYYNRERDKLKDKLRHVTGRAS